jgi:gliding motility-associatede transport system auxiliary component
MTARPALLLAVQIATVMAILACLVALAVLHPRRLDLTPERRFTLSPYTGDVLAKLDHDVRITVFYSSQAGALRREMADLLDLYGEAQPRVTVRYLDLDRSPGAAKRLGADAYNTAVVEAGERREIVTLVNEENVTAALLAIAGTPPVVTYFIVGHGEHDPRDDDERHGASEAARALAAEGFDVRVIEGAASIPRDAGLVVLAGPTRELTAAETDALAGFVTGGGDALVLADPGAPRSVVGLLKRFGIELLGDLVVDERGRLFGTDGLSARVAYLNQDLIRTTTDVRGLLPEAQTLRLLDAPGVETEYLATTAEDSWADVSRGARGEGAATFRPGEDRHGPLPVAAFARAGEDGHEGRLVAIGDADFVTNLHLNMLGNRDLLLATAGLVARARALAAARPAGPPGGTFSPLTLTDRQARLVFWLAVIAPTVVLGSIAFAMARRRRFA